MPIHSTTHMHTSLHRNTMQPHIPKYSLLPPSPPAASSPNTIEGKGVSSRKTETFGLRKSQRSILFRLG